MSKNNIALKFLFCVYILGISLPSFFIGIASFPIIIWPLGFLLGYRLIFNKSYIKTMCFLIISILSLVFFSMNKSVSQIEILKSALGTFAFLSTLIILPTLLIKETKNSILILKIILFIHLVAFFLEYFGWFNAKDAGIAIYGFAQGDSRTIIQSRVSGLTVEPSWYSLTVSLISYYLLKQKALSRWLFLVIISSLILSDSAIGIFSIFLLFAAYIWSIAKSQYFNNYRFHPFLELGTIIVFLSIVIWVEIFFSFINNIISEELFFKIFFPFQNASGYIRFISPVSYIYDLFKQFPVTGFGFDYLNSVGCKENVGTSILPFNIILELGLLGLAVYTSTVWFVLKKNKPQIIDFIWMIFVLISIGMPYNPYNAFLIILSITGISHGAALHKSSSFQQ